jgi:hypothetical protein
VKTGNALAAFEEDRQSTTTRRTTAAPFRRSKTMKTYASVLVLGFALFGLAANAASQTPSRLNDKEVKQLITDTREAVDRFVDKMNPQMRTAILKGEDYSIDVKASLKEMDELGNKASSAFNPPNNAGVEVAAYLKKLKTFDKGLSQRPGLSGADKYWEDARPAFGRLAAAYRIDWSADPTNWSSHRVSDPEVSAAAQDIKKASGTLGKAVDNALKADKSVDKAARAAMTTQIKGLETAAEDFGKQFKDGRDAAPALARLSESLDKTAAAIPAAALAGPGGTSLESIKAKMSVLNRAFGK